MFALPVGRLYTNTLMVVRGSLQSREGLLLTDVSFQTLNDRKRLRSQMEQSVANGISLGVSSPLSELPMFVSEPTLRT